MNGQIDESTLDRLGEIRGKTVRRGLDSAINECLDLLENKAVTVEKGTKIENKTDCLNEDCKEELKEIAS